MVVLPAHFEPCPRCGRLITVDALNILGACTKDCGGSVTPPPVPPKGLMIALSRAHHCPDPDDCAFGGEGCHTTLGGAQ